MRGIPCSISCSRAVSPFKELRTLRFAAVVGPHGQSFGTIWIEMQMEREMKRARWNLFLMSKETTQACNCCFFVWSLSVTNIDFIWIQIGFAGRKISVLVVIQRRCTCTLPLAQAWSQREFNFNLVVKLRNRNLYFKGIYSNLWIDMQWSNLNVHEWRWVDIQNKYLMRGYLNQIFHERISKSNISWADI